MRDAPEQVRGGHGRGHGSRPATVDQVDLSPEAQRFIENGGPGKSADSTAHRARAFAEAHGLTGMPFGKIASAIARGDEASLIPAPAPTDPAADVVDPLSTDAAGTAEGAETSGTVEGTAGATGTDGTATPPTDATTDATIGDIVEEIVESQASDGADEGTTPSATPTVEAANDGTTDTTASLIEALDENAEDPSGEQTAA
jgi:hypothetical protein